MKKRILTLVLSLVLLLGVLPLHSLAAENPFVDVKESDWFYDAVLWAYENGVTKGIDETHFGPDSTVTRGQAVTFLWRAMGEPEPHTEKNPFEDVKPKDYFYKAVLWAVEEGITKGTDATHFDPKGTCSTMHIITFLYRTLGMGGDGWGQVGASWAANEDLLRDTGLDVSNKTNCPRAAVVTTLDRTVGDAANLTQLPEGVEAEAEEPPQAQNASALDAEDSAWLSVDAVDATVGEAKELNFTLTSSVIVPGFELRMNGNATSATLTDEDEDGIYTLAYTLNYGSVTSLRFTARVTLAGKTLESNEVVVRVSAAAHPNREAYISEVLPTVEGLMQSAIADLPADASEEDKADARADAIYSYLDSQTGYWEEGNPDYGNAAGGRKWIPGKVSDLRRGTEADGEPWTIYYTIDGAEYFASCMAEEPDTEGGGEYSYDRVNANILGFSGGNSWYTTTQEKAVVMGHFPKNSDETMAKSALACVETLKNAGYQVDERYDFRVSDFYDLEDYAVIIIRSHGSQCRVCTREVQTKENRKTYKTEIDNHLVSGGTGTDGVTKYYIKPAFFTHYYKDSGNYLTARWIHFGMCQGMNDSSLANAVINAGADCVTAFFRSVKTGYSTNMIATVLENMLNGKTIQQSVDAAKAEHGADDNHKKEVNGESVYDPNNSAILKVAGDTNETMHSRLNNGDFEYKLKLFGPYPFYYPDTFWRWAGEARPVTRLGCYGVYDKYAAYLSTGWDAYDNETTSLICQSILIPEDATTISFCYRVFTEEFGRGSARNDHFYSALVDTEGYIQKMLLNFGVCSNRSLFRLSDSKLHLGRTCYTMNCWYQKTMNVSDYRGKVVNLCFWVIDANDNDFDTAVLIDRIKVN